LVGNFAESVSNQTLESTEMVCCAEPNTLRERKYTSDID
jgi:hypothetical protein